MAADLNLEEELKSKEFRVAIFGSARPKPGEPVYQAAYKLAKNIADLDVDVITGGGPGIMEAASLGHKNGGTDNNSHSIGINIKLPFEQSVNPGVEVMDEHERFSTRLDEFMLLANAAVIMPGGIGTALELFYTWQLIQVNHICKIPLILVGDMWRDLIYWVIDHQLKGKYISPDDLNSVICVKDVDEAFEVLKDAKKAFDEQGPDVCLNWEKYGEKFNGELDESDKD
ncbi:MAG: hypothetical protein ACI9QC_000477 [Oceanicoccus sp.]|jgi:uncharacterized protein (TIGR00730 family)